MNLTMSPSPSPIVSVRPVSTQSAPGTAPTIDDSDHIMEELSRSSPKAPAVSAPVSVPAQSVTVSTAPTTVAVSASPVTVPVSATVSAAPVTVTGPAIATAAPATVTASSAIVTASVPTTFTLPVLTTSSSTVSASQVSVTPSTDSIDHEFPKFSGDQDSVDTKSRAYIRKCMTNEISGVDKDGLRTWSSKNTAHFLSWMIKKYNIPERFRGFSLEMAWHLGEEASTDYLYKVIMDSYLRTILLIFIGVSNKGLFSKYRLGGEVSLPHCLATGI